MLEHSNPGDHARLTVGVEREAVGEESAVEVALELGHDIEVGRKAAHVEAVGWAAVAVLVDG